MNKKEYEYKKFNVSAKRPTLNDLPHKDISHDHYHHTENINEHLRLTLQQLQQNKLTCDLQIQKRSLLQQQLKNIKNQNQELKQQIEQLKKQLLKISKKYAKVKEKKQCQKCKENSNNNDKIEKERQIYLNDRQMLQQQINNLKNQLQNSQKLQQNEKMYVLVDSLKKQLNNSFKKIQQQNKIIQFMNQKLSLFQKQNISIMKNVELLESKLSEIEIETLLSKKNKTGCHVCNTKKVLLSEIDYEKGLPKKRKRIGSIKNMKRSNKQYEDSDELQQYEI